MVPLERIRIGVVGLKFGRHIIEKHILEGPARDFFELAGVCSLDSQETKAAALRYSVTPYPNLESMLAERDIQAIALMTGPNGRGELIRKAVRAGKHVMTTKPFEVDPERGLAALLEARTLGCVVHLNSPSPVPPADLKKIQEWRETFHLGRAVAAHWRQWVSYREHADGSWYDDAVKCPAAPIFRLGIYGINDIVRLFGRPESVQVLSSRLFTGRPTPDNATLSIKFTNGALATVFASCCVNDGKGYSDKLTLHFENGTVYRNPSPDQDMRSEFTILELAISRDGSCVIADRARIPRSECSGAYRWDTFYRAVRGEPLVNEISPEHIIDGVRIIDAMRRAERSGCTVMIPDRP